MTHRELGLTATTLIVAGSEMSNYNHLHTTHTQQANPSDTAATILSGLIYLLLSNPPVLEELTSAIRTDFNPTETPSPAQLQQHEYLDAVLKEALRLYPPAPDMLFRTTAVEPAMVAGRLVPPHTSVTMNLWAAHRSPENFYRPAEFLPERWMGNAPTEFDGDDRDVFRPFSTGPRDCVGKK